LICSFQIFDAAPFEIVLVGAHQRTTKPTGDWRAAMTVRDCHVSRHRDHARSADKPARLRSLTSE
jgi:hypothetical protein